MNGSRQPGIYSTFVYQDAIKRRNRGGKKAKNPKRLSIYVKEIHLLSKIKITVISHGVGRWIK